MKRLAFLILSCASMSAFGADVRVQTYGSATDVQPRYMRNLVCISNSTCYSFSIDNESGGGLTGFVYRKTTDGGASWASPVVVQTNSTQEGGDVWYDQWTPGDTGTKIHMWYFDNTSDRVSWRTLDTSSDTLNTAVQVFGGASAVGGRGAFVSGTKTRSGYLYCAYDIDAGAEKGLHRSTDSGATWSASLSSTFVEATIDECMLFPATGTGDNNDMWCIYQDSSTDELTMKMWDSSAAAQVESSSMATVIECSVDESCQRNFAGAIRLSDGHLIMGAITRVISGTADFKTWDVSGVTASSQTGITAKTNIFTGITQSASGNVMYPSFYVNSSDVIYVAYSGKRDASETLGTTKVYYTKSTDGGTNWSAGDTTYMVGTATDTRQTWSSNSGPRFLVQWRQDVASPNSGLWTNAANSIVSTSPNGFFQLLNPGQ